MIARHATLIAAALAALTTLATLATGCAPHITPYHPKHRKLDQTEYGTRSKPVGGSLYAEGAPGLYDDPSAARVGDILVIKINEQDVASHQADTTLNRSDATTYGVPGAVGLLAAIQAKFPGVDPTKLLATTSNQQFTGNGAIKHEGNVTATLPVRVMQILPSGDLFVEGTKIVMVADQEHHIYVSGVVRRIDIADDDSIPSSRIADAEIEYTGQGDISDTQRRGWLGRTLSKIWPF
jgi:flagellar L-ring protein FlgH